MPKIARFGLIFPPNPKGGRMVMLFKKKDSLGDCAPLSYHGRQVKTRTHYTALFAISAEVSPSSLAHAATQAAVLRHKSVLFHSTQFGNCVNNDMSRIALPRGWFQPSGAGFRSALANWSWVTPVGKCRPGGQFPGGDFTQLLLYTSTYPRKENK